MRIIDNGHKYALRHLDGEGEELITFVKREGSGYPGNVGTYSGTTMQECLRALVQRAKYVNSQIFSKETAKAIAAMTEAIFLFEVRAAKRHGRKIDFTREEAVNGPTCEKCGHVGCKGKCH